MPGQPKILEYLWFHDSASQKNVSRKCIIDKSTVTSLLKRMEKLDLIRKFRVWPENQSYDCSLPTSPSSINF